MGSKKKIKASDISKGKYLRQIGDESDEYYEVGDYYPQAGGWELRYKGKNTLHSRGINIHLKPEDIEGFELLDD